MADDAGGDREAEILRRLGSGAGLAGQDLRGMSLGREALTARLPATGDAPWWDAGRGGLGLEGADLTDTCLIDADLTGASLSRARLGKAVCRSARLDGASLEGADCAGADLGGCTLTGAAGGEADFSGAMLEDADLDGASMRYASFERALLDGTRFAGADLWGARFTGADADDAVFRGARLDEADLSDVNLTQADFSGASLRKARLVGSRLQGANLAGATLSGADLSGANLSGTALERMDLSVCNLRHARFAGAWMAGTRMHADQLGGCVGEEAAGEHEAARASYLVLEQNFKSLGSHGEASWAYKRGRRMGRMLSGRRAAEAWRERRFRDGLPDAYHWAADWFVEWLCDYGESLSRIVRAFLATALVFAALYGVTGGLVPEGAHEGTRHPLDLLSYSLINILTSNPPEIGIKPTGGVTNLLVGLEGALGIILMGLFGFVLGNRLRR